MKIKFNFRTKTANALGPDMCNELQERMNQLTQKSQVETILWNLTFNPAETAESFGISSENLDEKKVGIIRNEIGYQFRNIWNDWNYGKEEFLDSQFVENPEYVQLKKALKYDAYALYEVIEHCKAYTYMDVDAINKTLACLRSTWSTSHDKAFCRLNFNEMEQKYLLNVRKEIADFLAFLCKEMLKNETANVTVSEHVTEKTADLQKEDANSKKEELQKTKNSSEKNCMSPSELIAYKSQIKAFFEAYDNVKMPEWLMANRAKIEKIFEACECL